jgi:transcriptional regulator with XRE-family HTH domain
MGRLLREARKQSGLTQAEVAKVLGCQQGFISQIETGWKGLEPIELENFAHLYGKTLNDFATWREDQPTTEELRYRAKLNQQKALEFQRHYYKKNPAAPDTEEGDSESRFGALTEQPPSAESP